MPHHVGADDDDPIIASYPIYLTSLHAPAPSSGTAATGPEASKKRKLLVLQYPAHRPAETPYNARNLQAPTSLRLKPSTGLLEVDIPIDTKLNYNPHKGSSYATSLARSRLAQEGGTHGLSGGFSTGPVGRTFREEEKEIDLKGIPAHSSTSGDGTANNTSANMLHLQTMCGKMVEPSAGDPIYMLGRFENNAMHLSRLDALVQVRPELHHLDAAEEVERSILTTAQRGKSKEGAEATAAAAPTATAAPMPPSAPQQTKPEGKAIDIKLKPSGGPAHSTDPTSNSNLRLLRAIQQEAWQSYRWIDEADARSTRMSRKALTLPQQDNRTETTTTTTTSTTTTSRKLRSAISNSEWLNLMSAPRLEHSKKGDKGLLGKVRGREREKMRRKRNEVARRGRANNANANLNPANAATGPATAAMSTAALAGDGNRGQRPDEEGRGGAMQAEAEAEAVHPAQNPSEVQRVGLTDDDYSSSGGGIGSDSSSGGGRGGGGGDAV